MNDRLAATAAPPARHAALFERQRRAFLQAPCPSAAQRRDDLRRLKRELLRHQDVLAEAMSQDFGYRAPAESKMLDILGSTLEINHALRHLGRWMQPRRRATELLFLTNRLRVTYQPKGVVGVIVPWNFPIYLALGPLAAALAAGNRVMVKMPEATPATNACLRRLLAEAFSEDQVAVVGEELLDPGEFTALPFDHIVFTGSPAVGRTVMRTAAEHLTPVTLELGGKSPAVVLPGCDIAEAATRIVHGKLANCGQICVAPDYALVPRASVKAFAQQVHPPGRQVQLQGDPRVQGHEGGQHVGQQEGCKVAGHGHAQTPTGRRLPVFAQGGDGLDFCGHLAGVLQQQAAEFGEGLTACGAQQQPLAQVGFEPGDATRHRGLGQPQALGRAAEAAQVGHAGEDQQVVGLDACGGFVILFHGRINVTHFRLLSGELLRNKVHSSTHSLGALS